MNNYDSRTNYLTVITDMSGHTLQTGQASSPLMTSADFQAAFDPVINLAAGTRLQDLGRFIVVYSTATGSPHIAKFRQVMVVNGANQEGTNPGGIYYICTWIDSATNGGTRPTSWRGVAARTG